MKPTHLICTICKDEQLMTVERRRFYTCKKCGQLYELVPTRFGVAMLLVGKPKNEEGGGKIEIHKDS